jgi:hypothetical protein
VPFEIPQLQLFFTNNCSCIESRAHRVLVNRIHSCLEDLITRKAPLSIPRFAISTHP